MIVQKAAAIFLNLKKKDTFKEKIPEMIMLKQNLILVLALLATQATKTIEIFRIQSLQPLHLFLHKIIINSKKASLMEKEKIVSEEVGRIVMITKTTKLRCRELKIKFLLGDWTISYRMRTS